MSRVVGIIALVVLIAPFSGCFGGKEDAPATTSSSAADQGAALSTPGSPPVASLNITMDGNATESNATTGAISVKVGVNLTFDASASTGSNLTFAWDLGDNTTIGTIPAMPEPSNGTSDPNATGSGNGTLLFVLPFLGGFEVNETEENTTADANATAGPENTVVEHAYSAVGSYNVTVYVTDEWNQTGTAKAVIEVAASGPAPGTKLREKPEAFGSTAASTILYNGGCGTLAAWDWNLVDVEEDGTKSSVKWANISMAAPGGTQSGGYTVLALKDPAGKLVKENRVGVAQKTVSVEGPLAAGKYKVEAQLCTTATTGVWANAVAAAVTGKATYVAA